MTSSLLVGIGGGTASGKTTLARCLAARRADVLLLSHDRYYRDVQDPSAHNYDHPDALDNALLASHLRALRRGQAIEVPEYDFANHRRRKQGTWIEPSPVVVIEGILVLAIPSLREQFDLTVFVAADEGVRLARRIERDAVERGRSEASVRAQYAATVAPMHERFVAPSAVGVDLSLDGAGAFEDAFAELSAALNARVVEAAAEGAT